MTVYFLGAGPGVPDLLTVRGAAVLAGADVAVYGADVGQAVLDLIPGHVERVDIGPGSSRGIRTQADVDALLVSYGESGRATVRLTAGDPFAFSAAADEVSAVRGAGVDFEVIPGVSAAMAVPAHAGIPVTLPQSSTSFTVVTWHGDPVAPEAPVDWDAIARTGGTIVLLDSAPRLRDIAEQLLLAGLSPETPAAAIQHGATAEQHTIRATLAALAAQDLTEGSTVIVGQVAGSDLGWFAHRPLFGKRVVVTRPRAQASILVDRLRELGAIPIEIPTIEIADPADGGEALAEAVDRLGDYDWVALTSPNGAERLLGALHDARDLGGVGLAAIGPGTAAVMAAANLVADLVPERYVAEGLLEVFPEPPDDGGRVLLVRAAEARDILPDGLREAGWEVDVIEAYQTVPAEIADGQRDQVATADIATFTSSSTVARFVDAFGLASAPPVVACLGPITARTARDLGIEVTVEAEVATVDGLVDALVAASG